MVANRVQTAILEPMKTNGRTTISYLPIAKAYRYFLRLTHMQLFISLVSLPILVSWGLPISLLTIVGNFVFGYFLLVFLLISAVAFFLELLHLPNGLFLSILEYLTTIWLYLLHRVEASTWTLTFVRPSIFLLCAIPVTTALLLQYKKIFSLTHSVLFMLALNVGIMGYLKLYTQPPSVNTTLTHGNNNLRIIRKHKKTMLIDTGIFNQQPSADSWIDYTLIPALTTQCGTPTIDHYVCLVCNTRSLSGLAQLCKKKIVKKIYLPFWHETDGPTSLRRTYGYVMYHAKNNGVKVERLGNRKTTIEVGNDHYIVQPTGKTIEKKEFSYPGFEIVGSDGNLVNTVSLGERNA